MCHAFVGGGAVSIVVVIHADYIFASGLKSRHDKFCEDLKFVRSYQQPRGVAVVRRLPIFSRLGCRDNADIILDLR